MHNEQLITKEQLTKIGTVYCFWSYLCCFFFGTNLFPFFVVIHFPLIFLNVGKFCLKHYRHAQFRKETQIFITRVVLQMRVGRSFRESLKIENDNNSSFTRSKFARIIENVVFLQQKTDFSPDRFVCDLVNTLAEVDKNPVNSLKKLEDYLYQLKLESDFRHRSGQMLAQNRTQAVVLTALYLLLLLFVVLNFQIQKNLAVILLSLSMFVPGILWITQLGRKMRWKT